MDGNKQKGGEMSLAYITHAAYTYDNNNVLCIAYVQDGVYSLMVTSDREAFERWVCQAPTIQSPPHWEDLQRWGDALAYRGRRRGTRIFTGWSARAFIRELLDYVKVAQHRPHVSGWEMRPYSVEVPIHLTKECIASLPPEERESGLDGPHQACFLIREADRYLLHTVYSRQQVTVLAIHNGRVEKEIYRHGFALRLLPDWSEHRMHAIGRDSWIDQRAVRLIVMWIRVNRTLRRIGCLDA